MCLSEGGMYGMLFGIYACGGRVYLFARSCVVAVWMQMQLGVIRTGMRSSYQ
jgi:hypothetical protein